MSNIDFTDYDLDNVEKGKDKKIQLRSKSSKGIVAKFYNWRRNHLVHKLEKSSESFQRYNQIVDSVRKEHPYKPIYGETKLHKKQFKLNDLADKIYILDRRYQNYLTFKFRLLKLKESMLGNVEKKSKLANQEDSDLKKSNNASSIDDREKAPVEVPEKVENVPEKAENEVSVDNNANGTLKEKDIEEVINDAAREIQKGGSAKAKVDQFKDDNERKYYEIPFSNESFNSLGNDEKPKFNVDGDVSMGVPAPDNSIDLAGNKDDNNREIAPVVENMAFSRISKPYISENGKSKVFDFSPAVEKDEDVDSYMNESGSMVTVSNDGKSKKIEFNYEEKLQEEIDELFNKQIDGIDLNLSEEEIKKAKDGIKKIVLNERENKEKATKAEEAAKRVKEKQDVAKEAFFNKLSSREKDTATTNEQLTSQISEFDKKTQMYDQAIKRFTNEAMNVVSNNQALESMLNDGPTEKGNLVAKGK